MSKGFASRVGVTLDQFEDQVVLKEIAAAELDCKHAQKALQDLLFLGRLSQLVSAPLPDDFAEKVQRLREIAEKCRASTGGGSYQIVGGLDDWQTNTAVCDIMKPFKPLAVVSLCNSLVGYQGRIVTLAHSTLTALARTQFHCRKAPASRER